MNATIKHVKKYAFGLTVLLGFSTYSQACSIEKDLPQDKTIPVIQEGDTQKTSQLLSSPENTNYVLAYNSKFEHTRDEIQSDGLELKHEAHEHKEEVQKEGKEYIDKEKTKFMDR